MQRHVSPAETHTGMCMSSAEIASREPPEAQGKERLAVLESRKHCGSNVVETPYFLIRKNAGSLTRL